MASEYVPEDISILYPTVHPLKIFDAAKSENRFLHVSAPMVRYSKLAFRQTVFEFGADLTFTPMVIAKEFNRNQIARDSDFTVSTIQPQPPTIVQLGASSALEFSRAATLAAPFASGIDLNCGCPQAWACASNMGAANLDRREVVRDMVVEAAARMREDGWLRDKQSSRGRSISVKIRIHKDLRNTVDFLNTVIGDPNHPLVDWITIHPRTRHTPSSAPINTEALRILTSEFGSKLPILLSGDVFALSTLPLATLARNRQSSTRPSTFTTSSPPTNDGHTEPGQIQDQQQRLATGATTPHRTRALDSINPHTTGIAGLMSARALLANPALFAGYDACPWAAVDSFLRNVVRAPIPYQLVQHHLGEMCGPGFGPDRAVSLLDKHERKEMLGKENLVDVIDFVDEKVRVKIGRENGVCREWGGAG